MQPEDIKPQKYVDGLVVKSCKVVDVFDKDTLNGAFKKKRTPLFAIVLDTIWLRGQLGSAKITIEVKLLLSTQKDARLTSSKKQTIHTKEKDYKRNFWNKCFSVDFGSTKEITRSISGSQRQFNPTLL